MTNYKSLTAEIARLQAQADKLKQSEKSGIIAQARKAIEGHDDPISPEDIAELATEFPVREGRGGRRGGR